MKVESIKIEVPADARYLVQTLEEEGYESYVVGGCVRDALMGRVPHDWDICTSARPEEVERIFLSRKKKVVETGLKHGTVTVVMHGEGYEITTFRCDGDYTDGRHPDSVEFVKSLEEDLKRRDFTINAMAYSDLRGLMDPHDGSGDLQRKRIRCVGKPEERFSEDVLRIMRAIRFASVFGYTIEEKTSAAIRANIPRIFEASMERITVEFRKMIVGEGFPSLADQFSDLITFLIPEFRPCIGFKQKTHWHQYDVWTHILKSVENVPCEAEIERLAMFFHDIEKPSCVIYKEDGSTSFKGHAHVGAVTTDQILRRMKFDNATRELVTELVDYHDSLWNPTKKGMKRFLGKIGPEQMERLFVVRRADILAQNELHIPEQMEELERAVTLYKQILAENACVSLKDLAVKGADLIELGIEKGPRMGQILNELLEEVISENLPNEKEVLLEAVRKRDYCSQVLQA
ncbi:MAG: CCA tRNA nucleotidyltransferase [Blautia sp.]|nr:CCA tRNA nucleotidyltransferase [Blautia sp.]